MFQIKDGETLDIPPLSSTPLVIEFNVVLRRKCNDAQFQDRGGGLTAQQCECGSSTGEGGQKCKVTVESKRSDAEFIHKCQNSRPQEATEFSQQDECLETVVCHVGNFKNESRMSTRTCAQRAHEGRQVLAAFELHISGEWFGRGVIGSVTPEETQNVVGLDTKKKHKGSRRANEESKYS